jgi:hypothetical protein
LIARSVSDKPGPEARSPGSQESTFKVRVSKREAAGGKSDSETEAGVGQSRSRVEEKEQGDSETKKNPRSRVDVKNRLTTCFRFLHYNATGPLRAKHSVMRKTITSLGDIHKKPTRRS